MPPYNEDDGPKVVDRFDKFMAGALAIFALLLGVIAILSVYAMGVALWQAGVLVSFIIITVCIISFIIIRKIYQYILEKDFL